MAKNARHSWSRWTDTDDAVVLTFYPAEAAAILGRTLKAIYHRRSLKDLGRAAYKRRRPRKRLRREFFQRNSQGPREEAATPRPLAPATCRLCPAPAFTRGVCRKCYDRVYWLIRVGRISKEVAERNWFSTSKKGPGK